MKLIKTSDQVADPESVSSAPQANEGAKESGRSGITRREFLHNSSLVAGGAALSTMFAPGMIRKAEAKVASGGGAVTEVKTVCTHCSVGCGIIAEVQSGVWTGQEPAFDNPFNLGAHCAKGASVREHGHGERRLKYPNMLTPSRLRCSADSAGKIPLSE